MKRLVVLGGLCAALAGCQTVGGPGVSSYFDCRDGDMLKVTYTKHGAVMQIGKGVPIHMRSVSAVGGSNFEGMGYSLRVVGDTATWSGKTREAPHMCRRVAVPR